MIKTDAGGDVYIPLPHEARDVITLELLKEDYKTLMHAHCHSTERLYRQPSNQVAQAEYEHEAKYKAAFETLIEYYGG